MSQRDHGIYSRDDLRARGLGPKQIRALCGRGDLRRVARGWYATAAADAGAVAALAAGGRLTCVSAARLHGLWVPWAAEPHAYTRRGRTLRGFVTHLPCIDAWPDREPIAGLHLSLRHAARCLSAEHAAILLESALDRRLLRPSELPEILGDLHETRRRKIGTIHRTSQSGSETRVARWLRGRGVDFRQQARIPGVGHVDMLVGQSWIIEVDGRQHHSLAADYENDRRRDLLAQRMGYRVTRLSYTQVWVDWDHTQQELAAILARRQHRRAPWQTEPN
ncbi:DUF559 domain-containing protein [Ruania suaedae]|uniref:type IV toxin-antitoxin system AbiEi family antitoxin domain-containing protein n=1 Tax=Ruania suaedae TaxID=2897774 RepID=UPI001E42B8EE|nr:type IV toxin-antitoxin system AbiEi family antitoxin domain-containing protein [Ruania suaedae]UFU02616.1 DUF559 domain-containing protein [Ruania suaedae]